MTTEKLSDHDLLIRIDSELSNLSKRFDEDRAFYADNRVVCQKQMYHALAKKVDKTEFQGVKLIAFGLVAIIGAGVGAGILKLIINHV